MDIETLPEVDRLFLIERHLISPDLLKNASNASVLLKKDETISIMINEEDHIRMQSIQHGLDLDEAYAIASDIDSELGSKLKYSFDPQLGYLTACPTNLGTGMRASVMLHLPALKLVNGLANVFSAFSKVGFTVRGIYGEGTEALGDMYQISNRTSLGLKAEDLLQNVKRAANKIIDSEKLARENLIKNQKNEIEDRIFRSYATLKYARMLNSKEFMGLISDLKLGIYLGLLNDNDNNTADKLIIDMQPAGISKRLNKDVNPEQRDLTRAKIVRQTLNKHITE